MMKFFSLITCLVCFYSTAYSQEVQISFDDLGKYNTISQQLESRMKLFTEYPNFREANLFQTGLETYILEITYLKDGKLVRDRKPLTKPELDDLRQRFSSNLFYQEKTNRLNQEGRALFLTTTTTWGAGFYGYMIPMSFNLSSRQSLGTWMLITGASFYGPFLATKDSDVSSASAKASLYGATRSFFHGAAFYHLAVGNNGGNSKGLILTAASTSIVEMVAGYQYAKATQMSEGRVDAIGIFTDVSMVGSWLASYSILGDFSTKTSSIALLGTGLGIYTGIQYSKNEDKSPGDVVMMYSSTFVGAYGMASVFNLISNNDDRLVSAGVALGSGLGLAYGNKLAADFDFSNEQGNYILYSTLAGFATGYGAAYSFFGNLTESNLKPYAVLGTLGGVSGFYIMFNYLKADAKILKAESETSNVSFQINPMGIASYLGSQKGGFAMPGNFFNLNVRF